MRRNSVVVILCLVSLMTTSRVARADFWGTVGKKSGPGPFRRFEWVFPISFSGTAPLSLKTINSNHDALDRFFFGGRLPRFSLTVQDFLVNTEQILYYGEVLNIDGLREWEAGTLDDGARVQKYLRIVRESQASATGDVQIPEPPPADQEEDEWAAAAEFYEEQSRTVLAAATERVRSRLRTFGKSNYVFFGSQSAIPLIFDNDGNNTIRNLFLTFAVGYAESWENDLVYPRDNKADKTVKWVSLYPALEWRFGMTRDYSKNLFTSIGPAFHSFLGDAFESFEETSVRGRLGMRYHSMHFAFELEYFVDGIPHAEFGAVDDPTTHRLGWGVSVGFEIPALVWNR